jgi:hypothetical protein
LYPYTFLFDNYVRKATNANSSNKTALHFVGFTKTCSLTPPALLREMSKLRLEEHRQESDVPSRPTGRSCYVVSSWDGLNNPNRTFFHFEPRGTQTCNP